MGASLENPFYPNLFSPIKVGDIQVKNRIAHAPTGRGDCQPDGTPSDQTICSYVAIAKGGVGWITCEHTLATYTYGKGVPRILGIYDDHQLGMWGQLAEAVHASNVVFVVQLSIGLGRRARGHSIEVVGASDIAGEVPIGSCPPGLRMFEGTRGEHPRELATSEVEELEEAFVAAARKVRRAGFDGIEIHGAHGYLLAQFLSPATNKRQDKYGGNFEKRLALPINLIDKTRKAVGSKDFLVGIRISGDEHCSGGYTIKESTEMMPKLVNAGLDYVSLSSGCNEARKWFVPSNEGQMIPESTEIKKVSEVPVFCANIHSPVTGETVIEEGKADLISLSRSLISDPEWPNKARKGNVKEIIRCNFCNTCLTKQIIGHSIRCSRNHRVGWERFIPDYWPYPNSLYSG